MLLFFFFFKQKTAYEMRISDWSSDVCSSDLVGDREPARGTLQQAHAQRGCQLADAPDQARLGNPQRAFGCGEATVVDDGGKVVEVVEVLHGCSSKFRTICDIGTCLFQNSNNLSLPGRGIAAYRKPPS